MRPKVSVVIYNYNYGRYLQGAVDSVLSQTYPNVEVVILDNGSTDGSPDILRRWQSDSRVKILLKPDNSIAASRFYEPILQCQGEYIALLYADDYFLPERIEKQMACFDRLGPDYGVVYSSAWRENVVTGERWLMPVLGISGSILEDLLLKCFSHGDIVPAGTLIRRECFYRYPFYPDAYFEGEGYYLRLAMSYKFHCLNEPLAVMRDHATNLGKAIRHNAPDVLRYLKKIAAEPNFPPTAEAPLNVLRVRICRNYGWQGIRMLADGAWARTYLGEAVRSDPKQALHPRILAGLLLSWLPNSWLENLNGMANRFIHHREVVAVADVRGGR